MGGGGGGTSHVTVLHLAHSLVISRRASLQIKSEREREREREREADRQTD